MKFKPLLVLTLLEVIGSTLSPSAFAQSEQADPYQALIKREFGTATNELAKIEQEIQQAKPEQYPAIETKLIAVLETPDATMAGRQFACQMLRLVGSAKCVPAVGKLLTDEKLSHMARNVFLGLQTPTADAALRKALGSTQGNLRIGVINTIGDRRDRGALKGLAGLLGGEDEPTVRAALNAIGKIGGPAAADALDRAKRASDAFKDYWAHAYLRCAGSLAVAGDSKRSLKMYRTLYDGNYSAAIRAGAFLPLVKGQPDKAVALILALLASDDRIMSRVAVSAAISVPGTDITSGLARALPSSPSEIQVILLGALAGRGEPGTATEPVNQLARSGTPEVRLAAVKALGRLGNGSSVSVLAAAVPEGGLIAREAMNSMIELRSEGVTEALMKQAGNGDSGIRQALLGVLAQRGQAEALPAVRQAANDDDAGVRMAGLKALAVLGTQEDFSRLAGTLLARNDNSEQDQIAQTMAAIAGRLKDKTACCDAVLDALAKADGQAKVNLLAVLPSLGGDRALQALRECLKLDGEVRKAAVRTLADWPDAAPKADLLAVARSDADQNNQVLALRGYIRMLGLAAGSPAQKTDAYREAMGLATRPDEKKLVLTGLAEVAHVDALKLAAIYLEDPELKQEAYVAYEKIAESLSRQEPALAKEALQRVVDGAGERGPRNRAKRALDRLSK